MHQKKNYKLGALNKEKQTFDIELYDTTTELERIIVLDEPHFYRGMYLNI